MTDNGVADKRLKSMPAGGWLPRCCLALLVFTQAIYLVTRHFIMAYSDPNHWVYRAWQLLEGHPVTRRAPVYPFLLAFGLKVLGPFKVYLFNLPFLLLFTLLLYLVTVQIIRRDKVVPGIVSAPLAGLVCVSVFLLCEHEFLLILQNPYREAVAFTLLLGGVSCVLTCCNRKKPLWAFAAAVLFGFSAGTRETCVLIVLPVIGFFLARALRERDRFWWMALTAFMAAFVIGIIPVLVQNYRHSGHFWLPSYAANKWVQDGRVVLPRDIPIPGMTVSRFPLGHRESVRLFIENLGWLNIALFVLGLGLAFFRKQRKMIGLLFSFMVLNLVFYGFYIYVKGRYLFVVEMFFFPFIGLAGAWLAGGLFRLSARWGTVVRQWCERVIVASLPLAVIGVLVFTMTRPYYRFQLWDVPAFREAVLPALDTPCVFLGRTHYREMAAWLLQENFAHSEVGYNMNEYTIRDEGLETALEETGAKYLLAASTNVLYGIGPAQPPLLHHWLDARTVLDLEELPVLPDHYGEPIEGTIYRVTPWTNREVGIEVELSPGDQPMLLGLNVYRIWDYPERTWCRVIAEGEEVTGSVTNGFSFYELAGDLLTGKSFSVRLESDAPLPAEPVFHFWRLNETIPLSFGMQPRLWYYPYVSATLLQSPTKHDAFYLFDEGWVNLPCFASTGRLCFAEFRVEGGLRGPPTGKADRMQAETALGRCDMALPVPRTQRRFTVMLGEGAGHFTMQKVQLSTTVDSWDAQLGRLKDGTSQTVRYVKLYDVNVFSVPAALHASLEIDVGGTEDAPYVASGFHQRERTSDGAARWTEGLAEMRLPLKPGTGRKCIVVREFAIRPGEVRKAPGFRINGHRVLPDSVEEKRPDADTVEYRFVVADALLRDDAWDSLTIEVDPWSPADVLGVPDQRTLGLMLTSLEVKALE